MIHRPKRTSTSYEEVRPKDWKLGDLVEFGWLGLCEVVQEAKESNGWTAHLKAPDGSVCWARESREH